MAIIIVGDRGQDGSLLKTIIQNKKKKTKIVRINKSGVFIDDIKYKNRFSLFNFNDVSKLIKLTRPKKIYYLAAYHVSSQELENDDTPLNYSNYHKVNFIGLINFLYGMKTYAPKAKIFYAASSLVFSGEDVVYQNEKTPFTPNCFYGLSKVQGIFACQIFRKKYKIFAATGILYNHESHLRDKKFLSKKLVLAAHKISLGLKSNLIIGDLKSKTDWGYAIDFVDAYQRILSAKKPSDFIIATGKSHSVRQFADKIFSCFNLDYKKYVIENKSLTNRPSLLRIGNYSKLRRITGWRPKTDFNSMAKKIVDEYLKNYEKKK
jgi:GDPmannose 4,6-dehydratase